MLLRPVITIATFTFLEAMRNRLLWLVLGFLVAGFGLAEFVGEVAITEAREFQSGFLAAFARAFSVFMISLFVITSVVRELNDKGLELVLSLPIPRASYFFGKLCGFLLLASMTTLLCGLGVLLYAPIEQVLIWSVSLGCELMIVITFSLLCLFTLSHVTLALCVVMAFYVLSRTIGAFQLIGHGPLAETTTLSQRFINALIDGLAFVLPELHTFTLSQWLIYHTARWSDLLPILGQSGIYAALLAGAALFDLYRKNL